MPESISPVKTSNPTIPTPEANKASKATPKGIAANVSSIEEAKVQEKKSNGFFVSIKNSLNYFVNGIKEVLRSIFYRIFYCRSVPSKNELKYLDFQTRLERVDSLSPKLAFKEAEEFPLVYVHLGEAVYRKSLNLPWKVWVNIPKVGYKDFWKIGREETLKDNKVVIPFLKAYYKSEIERLKESISPQQLEDLEQ